MGRDQQFAIFSHLPEVAPEVFARAVCKLEEVDVQYNNLSFEQMKTLFEKMTSNQHCLERLVVSYDKRLRNMNESLVSKALLTVKDVGFYDLPAKILKHLMETAKVEPAAKTRYITVDTGTMRYQRMLEAALAQNENIRFKPHRTHPGMVGWREPTDYEMEISPEDYDRVREMDIERNNQMNDEILVSLTHSLLHALGHI